MPTPAEELASIRKLISSQPQDMQKHVKIAHEALKLTVQDYGAAGYLALALLGAEIIGEEDGTNHRD